MIGPSIIKALMGVTGEPALPYQYFCYISLPRTLLGSSILGQGASQALSLYLTLPAESCSIPGKGLQTTEFTMYGTTMKMPYAPIYQDFEVSFICSKSMIERHTFDLWMNSIHNPHNNYMNYFRDYTSTITVFKLNDQSITNVLSELKTGNLASILGFFSIYELQDVYPVSIQDQELAYDSVGNHLSLRVSFAYRKFISGIDALSPQNLPNAENPQVNAQVQTQLLNHLGKQAVAQGLVEMMKQFAS